VTGTTIVVRLSAFLLFCIGIQVSWNGVAELLSTLPLNNVN
jgi:small neutral amino acid transporter SnatA (MarC family)